MGVANGLVHTQDQTGRLARARQEVSFHQGGFPDMGRHVVGDGLGINVDTIPHTTYTKRDDV